MNPSTGFSPPARAVVVAAAVCVVVFFVRSAASVVAPILLALFIAVIASPPVRWMQRKGAPKYLAVPIILLVLTELGALIALTTTSALEGLQHNLPRYQERLLLLSEEFGRLLESVGIEKSREALRDLLNPTTASRFVYAMLSNASGTVATGVLVLLVVTFVLLDAPLLEAKLRKAFHLTNASEKQLEHLFTTINRYMLIKCLVSLATGICVWIWLRLLEIDYAAPLAMGAFVVNFLPIIGNILMTVPAVLLALVQYDISTAALVALGYVIINLVLGNFLEPRLMGRALGLSSLVVLLSLLFWGWVLGPIGFFLSVPLTMAIIVALDASPATRPIATVLGSAVHRSEAAGAKQLGAKSGAHGKAAGSAVSSDHAPNRN